MDSITVGQATLPCVFLFFFFCKWASLLAGGMDPLAMTAAGLAGGAPSLSVSTTGLLGAWPPLAMGAVGPAGGAAMLVGTIAMTGGIAVEDLVHSFQVSRLQAKCRVSLTNKRARDDEV